MTVTRGTTTRRTFLKSSAAVASASLLAAPVGIAQAQGTASAVSRGRGPLNILFVFTDQERFHDEWPKGLSLPGHERLERTGTTFTNHQCPATMCTSSRSVIVTGLQTANNGMFENLDVPWMRDLAAPTSGQMLRKAGYYTAYKGKWHLSRDFDTNSVDRFMTPHMEKYGFADNFSPGDLIGHTLGGYSFDHITAGSAINWLRTRGRPLSDDGKPWCMYVSFVNPHDVMYFNTDAPGESLQDTGKLRLQAARAPEHTLYKATWDVSVPDSLRQPFDAPGRPRAHGEFDRVWDHILGHIPPDEARWKRFNDYYLNCIRNVDRSVEALLAELEALQLDQNTIVIFTSDHGEMAGAHGLRGKGPFAYRQTNHLPLYVVHPDVKGGRQCRSLSGHIDLLPTMFSMAGVTADRAAELAGQALPGRDLAPLLANPASQPLDAARPATLFTYSGLASNDASVFDFAAKAALAGKDPKEEAKRQGFRPDLKKRGHVRSAFDGRYRFTRYFSPLDHNDPATIDELFKWNDVELYDLAADPAEMNNLAMDRKTNAELIATMNGKLSALIKAEIGKDDGRELPDIAGITWGLDQIDL
jgi:arylsulfatase A-like enzyme